MECQRSSQSVQRTRRLLSSRQGTHRREPRIPRTRRPPGGQKLPVHSWRRIQQTGQSRLHRSRTARSREMSQPVNGLGCRRNRSTFGPRPGSAGRKEALCHTGCTYGHRPNLQPLRSCDSRECSRLEQLSPDSERTPTRWPRGLSGVRSFCSPWRPAPRGFRSSRRRMLLCRFLVLWPFSPLFRIRNARYTAYDARLFGSR